jgi:septum site-determining protein MinD
MRGVYAILGGTNNAGATTTAAALGASLAEGPLRVGIVDADLGRSSLADAVDVPADGPTIETVLAGNATLLDATYKRSRDFAVVPGATDREWDRNANVQIAADVVDVARRRYDVVLLDVGVGDRLEAMLWATLADRAVFTSTLDEASLSATADGRRAVEYLGTPVAGVVLTRVDAGGTPDLSAVERRVSAPVLAALPYDESAVASSAVGVPVIEHDPDSPSAKTYWELAARIAADEMPADPVVPSPLADGLDAESYVDPGATSSTDGDRESETTRGDGRSETVTTGEAEAAAEPETAAADQSGTTVSGERKQSDPEFDWVDADGTTGTSDEAVDAGQGEPPTGQRTADAGDAADRDGQTASDEEEDPVATAFKERMDDVREKREAERREEVGDGGLFNRFFD